MTMVVVVVIKAGIHKILLSDHDALLIEKALLWKLGRQLTNVSTGHYSENFRLHDTLHLKLSGFDYQWGIYY